MLSRHTSNKEGNYRVDNSGKKSIWQNKAAHDYWLSRLSLQQIVLKLTLTTSFRLTLHNLNCIGHFTLESVCGLDLKEARTGKEARFQSETQVRWRGMRIKSTQRKHLGLYDIEGQDRSRKANRMCHLRLWREGGMQMNILGRASATKRGILSKVQSYPYCR
jgi:hypothetical protein